MAGYDIRNKPGVRLGLLGARKLARLSQKQLAELVFISRSQLVAIELGTRDTSTETWKRLKLVLKMGKVEELWERYNYVDGQFVGEYGTKIKDSAQLN